MLWKLKYFGELFLRGLRNILFLCTILAASLLVYLGIFVVVDVFYFPETVPRPQKLTYKQQSLALDEPINEIDPQWAKLQKALRLLDASCPKISAWVQSRKEKNLLVYEESTPEYLAIFYFQFRELHLTKRVLDMPPARQAEILAHEYFHSRQGFTCHAKANIAKLFGIDSYPFVECPAYDYGDRVYWAVSRAN